MYLYFRQPEKKNRKWKKSCTFSYYLKSAKVKNVPHFILNSLKKKNRKRKRSCTLSFQECKSKKCTSFYFGQPGKNWKKEDYVLCHFESAKEKNVPRFILNSLKKKKKKKQKTKKCTLSFQECQSKSVRQFIVHRINLINKGILFIGLKARIIGRA